MCICVFMYIFIRLYSVFWNWKCFEQIIGWQRLMAQTSLAKSNRNSNPKKGEEERAKTHSIYKRLLIHSSSSKYYYKYILDYYLVWVFLFGVLSIFFLFGVSDVSFVCRIIFFFSSFIPKRAATHFSLFFPQCKKT